MSVVFQLLSFSLVFMFSPQFLNYCKIEKAWRFMGWR